MITVIGYIDTDDLPLLKRAVRYDSDLPNLIDFLAKDRIYPYSIGGDKKIRINVIEEGER